MQKPALSAREWLPQALAGRLCRGPPLVDLGFDALQQSPQASSLVQCPIEQIGQSILVDVLRGVPISQVLAQDCVLQAADMVRWTTWVAAIPATATLLLRKLEVKYVLHG